MKQLSDALSTELRDELYDELTGKGKVERGNGKGAEEEKRRKVEGEMAKICTGNPWDETG